MATDDRENAKELKLLQYLNEAYGKEKELETALEAQIGMATRPPLKKRLQQHLKETKGHGREVERRIKKIAREAKVPQADAITTASTTAGAVASKAVAAAKGPLHALRGTGDAEKMLKNVKTAFSEEHEEIANYAAIEALATEVGDKETAQLARSIGREEQRMADFLERQIPVLAKAVAKEEIPAAQRKGGRRRSSRSSRSTSKSRSSTSSSGKRRSGARRTTSKR